MQAAKHNPEFAAKAGIPQSVAADFVAADKGKSGKGLPERKTRAQKRYSKEK